jgi:hypothetical protein
MAVLRLHMFWTRHVSFLSLLIAWMMSEINYRCTVELTGCESCRLPVKSTRRRWGKLWRRLSWVWWHRRRRTTTSHRSGSALTLLPSILVPVFSQMGTLQLCLKRGLQIADLEFFFSVCSVICARRGYWPTIIWISRCIGSKWHRLDLLFSGLANSINRSYFRRPQIVWRIGESPTAW